MMMKPEPTVTGAGFLAFLGINGPIAFSAKRLKSNKMRSVNAFGPFMAEQRSAFPAIYVQH